MNSTIKCCQDCKNRHLGCHGTCQNYIKAKAENEQKKLKAKIRREGSYCPSFHKPFIENRIYGAGLGF